MQIQERQENIAGWHDTKKRVVDAGVALLRARGFNGTSVDDICAAANVTKGGFFHYFKNKEELAQAAIARFNQGKIKEYEEAPFRKLADPLDRIFGRMDFVRDSLGGGTRLAKGCLIGMLAQELASSNPDIREACRQTFAKIAADFERDLTLAKEAYAPKAAFEPKRVATFYVTMVQGSLLMAKADENNSVLGANVSEFHSYLESLFNHSRPGKKLTGKASAPAARS